MTRLADIQAESTRPTEAPAIVQGSERGAVALFIEDARGDLVDIEYLCAADAWTDSRAGGALPWPCFDFGEYAVHCVECGILIDNGLS